MSASGKKKSAERKAAETQNVDHAAVAASAAANRLGTPGNPIQGPPLEDFTRGPETNYSVPRHRLDAGEAQLGTQANPIQGPALGSSPGVQNPGESTIGGPQALDPLSDEAGHSDETRTMHNMRMRAAQTAVSGQGTPGHLITTGEDGKQRNQRVSPRGNETAEAAARRVAAAGRNGGGDEPKPLKEEQDLEKLQSKHSMDLNKLTEKQEEARRKLGEKHTSEVEKSTEKGAKLTEKHTNDAEADASEEAVTRRSNERIEFDNEHAQLTQQQQEDFNKLLQEQESERNTMTAQHEEEIKAQRAKVSEAQEKQREAAKPNTGATHRRGRR